MKLQIDFYNKDEVSVFLETTPGETIEDENAFEPFLFGWFTLRQLHNLGHNTIIDAFVGLLTRNQNVTDLINEPPEIPPVIDLLIQAYSVAFDDVQRVDPILDSTLKIGIGKGATPNTGLTSDEYFSLMTRFEKDPAVNIIKRDYLKKLPRIVAYPGKYGSKRFIAMIGYDQEKGRQSFVLQHEGFGILGQEVNYYAPHSIIALLRSLAFKHSANEIYIKRLSSIAYLCGKSHMQKIITPNNQPELALRIFKMAEKAGQGESKDK